MVSFVGEGLSRRDLLKRAGVAGAAAAIASGPAALARAIPRAEGPGRRVAVLGGGMAGLTVAHELAERGFAVTVYEPVRLGGKARSIPVPGTKAGGRRPLPGEHGFRFFPGFYHHVPDSMRRTPFPGNANGVWDNLVGVWDSLSVRANGRPDAWILGMGYSPREILSVDGLRKILLEEIGQQKGVPPHELV